MELSDLDEVLRWVLSWGTEVDVLGPKKLREMVVCTARDIAEGYSACR